MSAGGGGETIRISLGPSASAVTSHLCNLEGLACTAPSSHPDDVAAGGGRPSCDPNVTHAVSGGSGGNELLVPRVLFVDGRDAFERSPWTHQQSLGRQHINQPQQQTQQQRQQIQQQSEHGSDIILSAAFASLNIAPDPHTSTGIPPPNGSPNTIVDPRVPPSHHRPGTAIGGSHNMGMQAHNMGIDSWSGDVAIHSRTDVANNSYGSNIGGNIGTGSSNHFHQNALSLTVSSKSRYRPSTHGGRFLYPTNTSANTNSHNPSQGRHMVWDSDEEEEEDNDDGYGYGNEEEQEEMKRIKERREGELWYDQERGGCQGLADMWERERMAAIHPASGEIQEPGDQTVESEAAREGDGETGTSPSGTGSGHRRQQPDLAWIDYFMPPHPPVSSYAALLPFNTSLIVSGDESSTQRQRSAYLSSFYAGYQPSSATDLSSGAGLSTSWREDVLTEKVRHLLEECDAVRGFQVVVEGGPSLHGGLATSLLKELGDECRSAGRFCISVDPASMAEDADRHVKLKASEFGRGVSLGDGSALGEAKVVESFRSALNGGLALHGLSSNADVFLPISLPSCGEALVGGAANNGGTTTFRSSAAAALAIEAAMLPYRLLGSSSSTSHSDAVRRSKIGIQSGYFAGSGQSANSSDSYATADCLSYHEFISCLKPSNRHSILELDALVRPRIGNGTSLNDALLQGTSVERKRLEAEANSHRGRHRYGGPPREVDPGLWLDSCQNYGGMLSPFSPVPLLGQASIRSNHSHFALSTSYRPAGSDPSADPTAAYTTLLMEGMGIRYRPEVSLGSVVRQSIRGLTGNAGYAAGSYWNSILTDASVEEDRSYLNTPVLSVLGNSTRIYPHLSTTSENFAAAVSRKYSGYMGRDAIAGLAPEGEDCEEAIEACHEMRDSYEPPMGSGLVDDDEGDYFSENED